MRMRSPIGVFTWILVALTGMTGGMKAWAEQPLTLERAIQLSLRMSERILIQRESVSAAEAAASGTRGAYDPFVGLQSGWSRASEPVNSLFSGAPRNEASPTSKLFQSNLSIRQLLPTGGALSVHAIGSQGRSNSTFDLLSPVYGTQIGVEFRQPLLRGRGVDAARLGIRQADADYDQSTAGMRREVTEIVASVEQGYWRLLAARRKVDVQKETVRLAEKQRAETLIRIENKMAPPAEEAQPRAEVERRRGDLLAAQEAVSQAENALKLLILSDNDSDLWNEALVPVEEAEAAPVPVNVSAAMEQALASRPELKAGEAFLARRQAESAYARNSVQPSFDLVIAYDRYGLAGSGNPALQLPSWVPGGIPSGVLGGLGKSFSRLGGGDFNSARVMLEFGFPLGNRGARTAAEAAGNVERQAKIDLAGARKAVRAEVLNAAAALNTAIQRIQTAHAEREAAKVQLTSEQERFAAGMSTNFLVLTRQNDLSRAQLAEISAMTDYRMARTEIGRATGALLEQHHIRLNELLR